MPTFDVTSNSAYRRHFDRVSRGVILVIGWGIFAEWLALLPSGVRVLRTAAVSGNLVMAGVAIAGLVVGPSILAFCNYLPLVRMSRGPDTVSVDGLGIELDFPNGRKVTVSWQDPRLDLVLHDDRSDPQVHPLIALDVELKGHAPFPIPLAAFMAIRTEAARLGLRVDEEGGGAGFQATGTAKIVRVRSGPLASSGAS
jgi:hypothetical protein